MAVSFPRTFGAVTSCCLAVPAAAQYTPSAAPGAGVAYSPYSEQDFLNQVLFGDTHLHTAFSADAGLAGARLTPDDAYRLARRRNGRSNTCG